MVPRYSMMEFPSYDGKGDPLGWLKCCERIFTNQGTSVGDRVGVRSTSWETHSFGLISWSRRNLTSAGSVLGTTAM